VACVQRTPDPLVSMAGPGRVERRLVRSRVRRRGQARICPATHREESILALDAIHAPSVDTSQPAARTYRRSSPMGGGGRRCSIVTSPLVGNANIAARPPSR
jgi:hypothetical protein